MKQANTVQRKWMADISEFIQDEGFEFLYGEEFKFTRTFELHHVVGRSAKQNKIPIGHEFILPVPFELHNVLSNHTENVTHYKKKFVARFGTQRSLFEKMVNNMELQGYTVPDLVILYAIVDTSA